MDHLAATYFQNNTASLGFFFFRRLLSMFRLITKREDSLYNKAVYLKLKIGLIFSSYTTRTSSNFYNLPKHFLIETFTIKKKTKKKKITIAKGA